MRKMWIVLHACAVSAMSMPLAAAVSPAAAQETSYSLTVQNGRFEPSNPGR